MRKILFGSWLLSLFFCLPLLAQDVTVSGRVTSSDDNGGLPGVSVQVKGTTRGTTTDASGNYKINAPGSARLVFSFIGYKRQEVAVGNQAQLNIKLENDAENLSEVVVVGYGASVSKKEATGATANVKGEVIENLPLQSFDRALQGRAAGVQITSSNGTP
ncbi:MAG: carboxypeptidase-like regulatory domain-containing protein, partial [Rudanella sp.]|nr:carboxypeptidase-like regulatory domain-containing protein [Rudanella sp.]